MSDTFQRSCEHWSEAGRREMEDFYALASVDYRHLAQALDWKHWLKGCQERAGERPLRLLDVACGSGKFPAALLRDADLASAPILPVDYALLDPSAFSIAEARRALAAPFEAGETFETTLQGLDCPRGAFDIVWATHALYALPAAELERGLERFMHALGGAGFIAHACADAHYLRFYRHYLDAFHGGQGVAYISAEEIVAALERMGVDAETRVISYRNGAPVAERSRVQGYLQRCVFDDSVDLDDLLAHPATGDYLANCRHDDGWWFPQRVMLIFLQARS
ncbi:MAG: class I SAM-dependent methyltransferase [Thiohalocapsa sp.]